MRIGVFDSGSGGELLAARLSEALPHHDYIVVNDREHVPYGSRTDSEVIALTDAAIQPLIKSDCPVILIACNTATMCAIRTLRERYPAICFVGIEPMIKPAAAISKTRHVTVLATPLTLASQRYRTLIAKHGGDLLIDQPDTSSWARMIDEKKQDDILLDGVHKSIASGSDTIVVACTHYLALLERCRERFPDVHLLEPTEAIVRQITHVTEK